MFQDCEGIVVRGGERDGSGVSEGRIGRADRAGYWGRSRGAERGVFNT